MKKSWLPIVEDMRAEIARLEAAISGLPFDSNFPNQMQIIKERIHELGMRLVATTHQTKSEFAAEQQGIAIAVAEFKKDCGAIFQSLSQLRQLRAERCHANHLHVKAIREAAEETTIQEGGEK